MNTPTAATTTTHPPLLTAPRSLGLLAVVCGLAFFWQLGGNGLFDLDEALYAACAREMHLRGDYVTPRVNGEPFFEKPPLAYWAAAAMFRLLGVNEFAARLPSALATTLLVGLIFWFGTRCFGRAAGLLAALGFALSPLVLAEARLLTMDALLDLWIAIALLCFFLDCTRPATDAPFTPDTRHPTPWLLGFWAACGLGVLTKGAPGIALPMLIAGGFLLLAERFQMRRVLRAIARLCAPTGLLLFLLIAVPWHLAAWQASGDVFTSEYIVRQHLQRFQGGDTAHRAPLWFYVPGFLVGFFPWSLFLPAAFRKEKASGLPPSSFPSPPSSARLLLKVWAVVVFLVFSASGSKLISYILPMYPAAALLVGDWLARALERKEARRPLLIGAGAAFPMGLLLFGIVLFHAPIVRLIEAQTNRTGLLEQVPPAMIAWAARLFGMAALATGVCFVCLLWERRREAVGALAVGMTAFTGIAVIEGLPILDATFARPLQSLATEAGREAESGASLVLCVGPPRRPSVFFYLPDSLFRPRGKGEMQVFETTDDTTLRRFLAQHRPALLLTDRQRAERLLADSDFRLLRQRGRWALLRVDEQAVSSKEQAGSPLPAAVRPTAPGAPQNGWPQAPPALKRNLLLAFALSRPVRQIHRIFGKYPVAFPIFVPT